MPAKKNVEAAEVAKVETPEENEVLDKEFERFIPEEGEPLKLEDGTLVTVRPLKLRELLALLKVVTRSTLSGIGGLAGASSQEDFAVNLIALLINAVPENPEEVCELLRILVDPVAPEGGWKDRDEKHNAEVHLDNLLLEDPEITDSIDIITTVAYREAGDLEKLGKRIEGAVQMFGRLQPKTSKKS